MCKQIIVTLFITSLLHSFVYGQDSIKPRYFNTTKLNVAFGVGNIRGIDDIPQKNSDDIASFIVINGIRLRNNYFGVGFGAQLFDSEVLFPILINYKTALCSKTNAPFTSVELGYLIGERNSNFFKDTENGGIFFGFEFGYQFELNKITILTSINYKYQIMDSSRQRNINPGVPTYENYQLYYNFLGISIGVQIF